MFLGGEQPSHSLEQSSLCEQWCVNDDNDETSLFVKADYCSSIVVRTMGAIVYCSQ